MIVFDLMCAGGGHVFEAWFGSGADYDAQRRRGLVACPVCGDEAVDKAAMAPRLASGQSRAEGGDPRSDPKAVLRMLAEAQARALAGSTWVGGRFATEARAIHDGTREAAAIHGSATAEEAKALIADGVAVAPLPLPVRPPGSDN